MKYITILYSVNGSNVVILMVNNTCPKNLEIMPRNMAQYGYQSSMTSLGLIIYM